MKVVAIISGGMDSITMLYRLLKDGYEVEAISFDYGQKHYKELTSAMKTCEKLGVKHNIIDITSITNFISNSALTSDEVVPEGHYEAENMKRTVVPSRNSIMAMIANGYAVNIDFDAIALGVHAGDHQIYFDCRPEFIEELKSLLKVNNEKQIDVLVPYLEMNKGSILKDGINLGVDYSLTWTCYNGKEKPCGKCGSCIERNLGFIENGIQDPLYTDEEWNKAIEFAKKSKEEYDAKRNIN